MTILQSSIRNSIKNLQEFILNDEGYNHSVSSENKLTLDPRSLLRNDDVLLIVFFTVFTAGREKSMLNSI